MKSTVENLEETKVKLTVEAEYDELKAEVDKAYKQIAQQVNIPGFRKGHVPPAIIDQRFGRGAVLEQAVNEKLPELLNNAIIEQDLRPLGQPEVEVVELPATAGKPGGNLVFTAEMNVVPEFAMPSLDGRTIKVSDIEVSDDELQAELDDLRGRFATLKDLDRPAEDGDYLTLNLVAMVEDQEVDTLADVSYELGSENMLDGQDEALRGAKTGDEIVFTSQVRGGQWAGQDAQITVNVLGVKERELPDLDDDFAQMVSEFDTAEELVEDTRKELKSKKRGNQAVEARDLLLQELVDEAELVLPPEIVEAEVLHRVGEEATEEQKQEASQDVEAQLKQQIFMDILAQKQEISVDQQELIDYMMHVSQTFGIDINEMFSDQDQIQRMYAEMARTKALVSVLKNTEVVDGQGNQVDISQYTQTPQEAQAKAQEEAAQAADDGSFVIDVDDLTDEN